MEKHSCTPGLIGKWLFVRHSFSEGKSMEYRETWTFYKNGILKWTEEEVGLGKSLDRYRYMVNGNKMTTVSIKNGIAEEAVFNINGDHLSMYDFAADDTFTLTRVKGN